MTVRTVFGGDSRRPRVRADDPPSVTLVDHGSVRTRFAIASMAASSDG